MLVHMQRILNADQLLYSLPLHWHVFLFSMHVINTSHRIVFCFCVFVLFCKRCVHLLFWSPHNSEIISRKLAESAWPVLSMRMFCKPVLLDSDVGEQSGPGLLVM